MVSKSLGDWRGKKQIPSHVFPHHPETPQAINKAEKSMTLKVHLEYVRISVSQHILYRGGGQKYREALLLNDCCGISS